MLVKQRRVIVLYILWLRTLSHNQQLGLLVYKVGLPAYLKSPWENYDVSNERENPYHASEIYLSYPLSVELTRSEGSSSISALDNTILFVFLTLLGSGFKPGVVHLFSFILISPLLSSMNSLHTVEVIIS